MADIMVTFAHDFATKWEMEAFARQDMKGFEAIKDQLVALGMTDAKHGILFGQKDKHRTIAVLSFKDIEAYQKCMEVIEGGDWDEEVVKVMRQENYVIDAEIVLKKNHEAFRSEMVVTKGAANVRQSRTVHFDIKNAKGNARRLFANCMVPRID